MKRSSIFWGSLFISFGTFVLIRQFGISDFSESWLLNLWPLLIIIWGISMLKIPIYVRKTLTSLSAIFLSLLIISLLCHNYNFNLFDTHFNNIKIDSDRNSYIEQHVVEIDSNCRTASFKIEAGAGSLLINDSTNKFCEIQTYTKLNNFNIINDDNDSSRKKIDIEMDTRNFFFGNQKKKAMVCKLNNSLIWDFNLEIGAMSLDADLSHFKIKSLSLDAGASNIWLILGQPLDSTNIIVNCGASAVKIRLPKSAACEIESNTGLSGRNYEGFIDKGDGIWRTENFDTIQKRIFISIAGGVSSFEVIRY
jgi:hypothetical protein